MSWEPGRHGRLGRASLLGALLALVPAGALPAVASAGAPNVLIVNTDDQRAEGTMQALPRTAQWLGGGGTEFTRSYVTTPLCCPSRASLFTGRYAHNHGIHENFSSDRVDQRTTMQRYLQRAGYHTAIVGKFLLSQPLEQVPRFWDEARVMVGGYRDTRWNVNGRTKSVSDYSTTYVRRESLRYIRRRDRDDRRPWFLYVAPSTPHGPIDPERRFAQAPVGPREHSAGLPEMDLSDKPPYLQALASQHALDPSEVEAVRVGQLRMLMSVDLMMRRLNQRLRASRELTRTLVIFTSDNGLLWGDRGGLVLKDLPYPESVEVPLLISWPGRIAAGVTDSRLVANVDLAPTVLDAAGLAPRRNPRMDGRSILGGARRDALLLEYGGLEGRIPAWNSIVTADRRQYVESALPDGDVFPEYYPSSDRQRLNNLLANGGGEQHSGAAELERMLRHFESCRGLACP